MRTPKPKVKVKKIVLFWMERIPKKGDAQAIADLLPQQMHQELVFETTKAAHEKISPKSIFKLIDKLIIPVTARLGVAVLEKDKRFKKHEKEEVLDIAMTRSWHIAVMQTILKTLKEKYRFNHAESPNKLICKVIETTIGLCYYALILDSEIDPSGYDFATGRGGSDLSTIFWEAANTRPVSIPPLRRDY